MFNTTGLSKNYKILSFTFERKLYIFKNIYVYIDKVILLMWFGSNMCYQSAVPGYLLRLAVKDVERENLIYVSISDKNAYSDA